MELTREIEWFLDTLQKEFGVEVSAEDVTVEAVELGKDEVDVFYLPIETIDVLPETLLYELLVVDDAQYNEWMGVIAFFPDSPEWCLQLILKNGQLFLRNVLPHIQ
ncbi:hypothetical protein MKY34_21805 [Sporosarcina sp. FSL K6-1522]|uniref:hypothetical protein n=1 Tax=Sporosarcina sp. FSL K6-1522 TaxID=2921554 RepID=UPI00315AA4F7